MTKNNSYLAVEKDCTNLCQSLVHGSIITSAITKRAVTDRQLASYFNILCGNYGQVKDDAGRTALHMAASCGRVDLCHWLLKYGNADLSARDKESLNTPLHRSLIYGQIDIAVLFIKLGANVFATDVDNLSCIDYAMKYRSPLLDYTHHNSSEVYIWGSNNNYTHGSGNQQSRQQPELVDMFRKNNIFFKQVCMGKFHSVFISSEGHAWACGHGMGGRLGVDSENTVLTPQPIKTGSEVVQAASIGRDHTVLLMESGAVWTCGLNTHHQLGHVPPPNKLLVPRPLPLNKITKGVTVIGVSAARFHTVFWTEDSLYTFGLHAGQLGHPALPESTIIAPRLVTSLNHNVSITHVATSDGATVVAVAKGDIYVLHQYQTRRIAARKLNVAKVVVSGGQLNAKADNKILMDQGGEDLMIVVLTTIGKIFIWLESIPQLTRCSYSIHRSIEITDIHVYYQNLLLATKDGEGFRGEMVAKSKKKLSNSVGMPKSSGTDKDDYLSIKLHRLPHLHRTVSITSDPKGCNFAAVQVHPKSALTEIPVLGPSCLAEDLGTLLMEASDQDCLHDIIFHVGYDRFAAHRYILRLNSELDTVKSEQDDLDDPIPVVKISNINPAVFQQLLQFVYTGDCDIIHPGPCNIKLPSGTIKTDPIRMALEASKKYKISNLIKILQCLKYDNAVIIKKDVLITNGFLQVPLPPVLDHKSFPDLYDVEISSSDGEIIKAHKCVLAARLEYFHSMLAGGWIETSATSSLKIQVPFAVLSDVIEFIYTDVVSKLHTSDDLEHICSLLIVADQMLIARLKELCEIALSNNLNLRNASHLMQFAATYHAEQLQQCCMQYISLNLPAILEMRTLEMVSPAVLKELSTYYKQMTPIMSQHIITPFSNAPTDEEIISASDLNSVVWEEYGDSEIEDFDCLSSRITPVKQQGKNSSFSSTSASGKKKRSHRMSTSEVQRKRYESISSNSDLDVTVSSLSFDDVHEEPSTEWITVDKTQKSIQSRLKVLVRASTIEPYSDEYVQLPLPSSVSSVMNIKNVTSPIAVMASSPPPPSLNNTTQFPQLSNQSFSKSVMSSSSRNSNTDVKKAPTIKLSQKQRKKLAAEGNNIINKEVAPSTVQPPKSSAWGTIPPLSSDSDFSLKNTYKEAKAKNTVLPPCESPGEKTSTSHNLVPSFSDIMAEEIKQKDNLSRMRTKSFQLTQIEDQAIEGLLLFYNAANVSDERITVKRVPYGNIAKPTWITSKRNNN
ncbi:inhibitor of Bruton tyrosine kinase [Lycorma delicatula]|uniref:inhibitor of Bruton tyrosine kinase n=1 Tax=Lycorma delicatula TaxID=130591 RepID=UPI003F512089